MTKHALTIAIAAWLSCGLLAGSQGLTQVNRKNVTMKPLSCAGQLRIIGVSAVFGPVMLAGIAVNYRTVLVPLSALRCG